MKFFYLFCFLLSSTTAIFGQENITASLIHDGEERKFNLHIPTNYQDGDQLPLVINMHGFNSNMTQQRLYSEFNPIADAENFIVVYPQGLFRTTAYGIGRHWNAYWGTDVDDLGFINHLIDYLYTVYQIDLSRVYATGMSNGGFMSYHLACELSDRIAAIASVTGTMSYEELLNCEPEYKVPVMEIHGTSDLIVPYDGNAAFAPAPEAVAFWVEHNSCNSSPTVTDVPNTSTLDLSTASYESYECEDNTEVIFYTIESGGHTWPGADIPNPAFGHTNRDFEASETIWAFFKRHQHPNPSAGTVVSNKEVVEKSAAWSVFPNPFTTELFFQNSGKEALQLQLFDAVGTMIGEKMLTGQDINTHLPVQQLKPGLYFLEIKSKNDLEVYKLLKI